MGLPRTPSTLAWIVTHLGYPLLPVALEAGIRFVVFRWHVDLDTLNAATLAMSVGLVSVFVNQSIRADEGALADKTEEDARNGTCTFFSTVGITFFVLFGVTVLLQTLVVDKKIEQLRTTLQAFQFIIIFGSSVPIVASVLAQRTYKLRAAIV